MTGVDVIGRADDVMARLGDNPSKRKLDRAWASSTPCWPGSRRQACHLLADR